VDLSDFSLDASSNQALNSSGIANTSYDDNGNLDEAIATREIGRSHFLRHAMDVVSTFFLI